jgi:hypothetical protein
MFIILFLSSIISLLLCYIIYLHLKIYGLNSAFDEYDKRIRLYRDIISKFYTPLGEPTNLNNENKPIWGNLGNPDLSISSDFRKFFNMSMGIKK